MSITVCPKRNTFFISSCHDTHNKVLAVTDSTGISCKVSCLQYVLTLTVKVYRARDETSQLAFALSCSFNKQLILPNFISSSNMTYHKVVVLGQALLLKTIVVKYTVIAEYQSH